MAVRYLDKATAVLLHLFCRCFALLRDLTLQCRAFEVKESEPSKITLLFVVAFFSEEKEHFIIVTLVKKVEEIGLFVRQAEFLPLHWVWNWEAVQLHEPITFLLPERDLSEVICQKRLLICLLHLSIFFNFDLS